MSITSRISSMEEHVTNAYNGLQGLGADLTNVDKNIDNIASVLDDIYDSMPQVSGEGTSLTLDDTRVGKIKSTLKGNTSQSGTPTPSSPIPVNVVSGDNVIRVCGKNLLNLGSVSGTNNNVAYSVNNGKLHLNGTCNSDRVTINLPTQQALNGTYTFSTDYLKATALKDSGGNNLFLTTSQSGVKTETINNPPSQLVIYGLTGVTFNNNEIEMMIEKGSSASTYEPYQGNTYNIDLPVENLLPDTSTTQTINGVTFTRNDNGTITINGTASYNADYYIYGQSTDTGSYLSFKKGKYSILTSQYKNGIVFLAREKTAGAKVESSTESQVTTLMNTQDCYFYGLLIRVEQGTSCNNIIIEPQLAQGTKVNSYTPYGTTPIELAEISTYNDEIFRTSGKNLYDGLYTAKRYINYNTGEMRTSDDWSATDYIEIEPNTSYTLSGITNSGWTAGTSFYDNSKAFISSVYSTAYTFTTPTNAKYLRLSLNSETPINIMLNEGSTALPYEPYGTGEWYLHKEIGEVVLDGSENWNDDNGTQGTDYRHNIYYSGRMSIPIAKGSNSTYLCNYFSPRNVGSDSAILGSFYMSNTWLVFPDKDKTYTLAQWKTWLGTNKPKINYVLAIPTYTKITSSNYPTLYSQLEAIYNAQGYDNQTNISQTNSDLPFKITASALKEWSV